MVDLKKLAKESGKAVLKGADNLFAISEEAQERAIKKAKRRSSLREKRADAELERLDKKLRLAKKRKELKELKEDEFDMFGGGGLF